jgi:hypothetical protein
LQRGHPDCYRIATALGSAGDAKDTVETQP